MSYLERFHSQLFGNSESPQKLVFLHGLMGFGLNWRRIAQAFEEEFQILTYDQRGHGRSVHTGVGSYTARLYAEDLQMILDELKWEKVTLVGHSMGARVALEFASAFAHRVSKLIIEDIGPIINETAANFIATLLTTVPVPFESKHEAKRYFEKDFQETFKAETNRQGLAQFLFANIMEDEQKRAVWRFDKAGILESLQASRSDNRWEQFDSLAIPTLLIRGERSNDLTKDVFDEVIRRNPRIEGVEIAGAGHWVHGDKPEEFIRQLAAFFSRHPLAH